MSWDGDEFDDDDVSSARDDDPTFPCPYCGEDIYDDTERCSACGKYISKEDAPSRLQPLWILIGIVICLLIVLAWVLGG